MKKFFTLIAIIFISLSAFANGVEIDGIYYLLNTEKKTASVTYMGTNHTTDNAYTGKIVIPEVVHYDTDYTVTAVGDRAFYNCKTMTDIVIPATVTSIGSQAFCYCYALKELTFPATVTYVGSYALTGIKSTTVFTCMALVPPSVQYNDIGNTKLTIHVPAEVIPKYKSALGWYNNTILPILLEVEQEETSNAVVTWLPVKNTDQYQIFIEGRKAGELIYTNTLSIAADSENGGIMKTSPSIHRVRLDDIGTIIVVTIDPLSGSTASDPFSMTVSTTQTDTINCRVKVQALNGDNTLKQDQITFSLSSDEEAPEAILSPSTSISLPTTLYDLQGRGYPIDQYQTLPAGIYLLRKEDGVVKVMKK